MVSRRPSRLLVATLLVTAALSVLGFAPAVSQFVVEGVSVTPDTGTQPGRAPQTGGYTATFTVTKTTGDRLPSTYNITCWGSSNVRCVGVDSTSVTVSLGSSKTVTASYAVASAGSGRLTLRAESALASDEGSYNVSVVTYTVSVTPDDRSVGVLASQTGRTQAFTIRHEGSASSTYNFAVLCTGTVVSGCTPPAPVRLATDAWTTVNVTYTSGASGTGRIRLLATDSANAAIKDSGWVNVSLGTVQPPTVTVAGANTGSVVERRLCLAIAAGSDAASECGDLRIVHPLATTRTLNKARTPTLIYNSQHAQPRPLIAAYVTLPATAATPDFVVATLRLNGDPTARGGGQWSGSDWAPGKTSRIVVADTLVPVLSTGLYNYTLEIVSWYGATPSMAPSATGQYVVVNRMNSSFGAGWWLAGLEQIFLPADTMKLWWVGGDGSFREYQRVAATSIWRAPSLDRLDSLTRQGSPGSYTYTRYLPHGLKVQFDNGGKHTTTVNRLGHTTTFQYDTNTHLFRILLPPDSSKRYQFAYTSQGFLGSVTAPPVGTTPRVTTLVHSTSASLVGQIRDPDNTSVFFYYGTGADANRIVKRTDRRFNSTQFAYDAGKKLNWSRLGMPSPQVPIIQRSRPFESLGLPGSGTPNAVDTAAVYTSHYGPRVDGIGDTTAFWLDVFGAPRRIVNALGLETVLTRGNGTFPALVTKVRYPNLRVVTATYDGHGNITSSTDSSVAPQNGKYATTRFFWNTKWDFDSIIAPPEGDSTVMSYDASNGNRIWQRDARGDSTGFAYYAADSVKGLLRSIRTPSQHWSDSRDSVEYNRVGNLFRTRTPVGFWTTHYTDSIGRDTLIRSPIDSAQTLSQTDTVRYDLADRETLRKTVGPAVSYLPGNFEPQPVTVGGQTLTVRRFYNAEGGPDSLSRSSSPDTNRIGVLTTRWSYDPAGRRVKEIAADGLADSTVYDPAGNPVELHTRRGHSITMVYDALDRLSRRIVPGLTYPVDTICLFDFPCWKFPYYYPNGLTIPTNIATFVYDSVGNLRRAWNGDARISRGYNQNGTVVADSLLIRNWADTGFTHIYVLQPSYDLDGRRVSLRHPSNIAPTVGQTLKDLQFYAYANGQLATVTDVLGNQFQYFYDVEGRLDSLNLPGHIYEKRFYDGDGRLRRRVERRYYTWAPGDSGFTRDTVRDETFSYDARDKITRVSTFSAMEPNYVWRDSTLTWYSGLGQMVAMRKWYSELAQQVLEEFRGDALANVQWKRYRRDTISLANLAVYQATTGRLVELTQQPTTPQTFPDIDSSRYDPSGNRDVWLEGQNSAGKFPYYGLPITQSPYAYSATHTYYDADQRLRLLDRRPGAFDTADVAHTTGPSEDYRYDALARRVLVRSRHDSVCAHTTWTPCSSIYSAIERTVWDGDQVLYEIRYPGADNISNTNLERDTPTIPAQETPFGRVAYTHGLGIDRPLDVIRIGYTGPSGASTTWTGPVAVMPHENWRGTFDQGTFDNGAYTRCTKKIVPPDSGSNTTDCVFVSWPGNNWRAFGGPEKNREPLSWFGSQIRQQQDFSSQFYRRNRYYDAFEGRFTQEDPNGLAGGLNLYGFAGGDPVNFSDPFGLCPPENREDCTQAAVGSADIAPSTDEGQGLLESIAEGLKDLACTLGCQPVPTLRPEVVSALGAIVDAGGQFRFGDIKAALKQVHEAVGKLPRGERGKFGSPQRGTSEKGYRLDPGHPNRAPGDPEAGPHINWWDWTAGKRGTGGRWGVVPIPPEESILWD